MSDFLFIFMPPLDGYLARTELSLIQNGNEITGIIFGDCIIEGRGDIIGVITGNNITFVSFLEAMH